MEPIDLLKKNLALFRTLREVVKRQLSFLSEDKIEPFIDLTYKREHLQHDIDRLEETYRARTQLMSEKALKALTGSVSMEIIEVIESIRDMDEKIRDLIQEGRDDVLRDLKKLRQGRKALKGYGGTFSASPKFIDRDG
jgi:hypothetical protein